MQEIIKFIYTVFTVVSVFFSSLFSPVTLSPETQGTDLSFLKYPDEAIVTLEQVGLTEKEFTERASAQLPEYVQSGGYARCFGICGEVSRSITNITFRNCAVFYRDGIWDNDRIGSLVIVAEQCDGGVDGVVFENIEIFRDEGRAILVKIYDEEKENFKIDNVEFKNITYTSYMQSKIAGTDSDTNTVKVTLKNVKSNGFTPNRFNRFFVLGEHCDVTFA